MNGAAASRIRRCPPRRLVAPILWRAWRGEDPAAIAAACLCSAQTVDGVLRTMRRALDQRREEPARNAGGERGRDAERRRLEVKGRAASRGFSASEETATAAAIGGGK